MYLCFEFMTLLSMPLVLHNGTSESIAAAKKYLFYSIFGATLGLLGMFFVNSYGTTLAFATGGVLDSAKIAGHETLILWVAFLSVAGFGAKAGLFPLHAWLPTAHPVAPAPASALLSGCITKAGVLCILAYNRLMIRVSHGVLFTIRGELFSKMQELPIRYFDTHPYGDTMSRFTNDTDSMRQMLSQTVPQVFSAILTVTFVFPSAGIVKL